MTTITVGFGDAAKMVEQLWRNERSHLRKNETFGLQSKIAEELADLWEDVRNADWDGYGALPVARETLHQTRELLERFPRNLPLPTLSAEPDGHLTLEWYRSPHRLLSVSVGPTGVMNYAAIRGPVQVAGVELSQGQWPQAILAWIERICTQ